MRLSPVGISVFPALLLAAWSGSAVAEPTSGNALKNAQVGVSSGPIVIPAPPIQGDGHILISTPNGWLKVYNAKKVAAAVGVSAEENGIHVCGNQLRVAVSPDHTKVFAACDALDGTGHPNTQDSMAANNVAVSLIDIKSLQSPTITLTVKKGATAGLTLSHPGSVSVSPDGKIVLVSDWYDVGNSTRQSVLHEFDENLQYIQTIAVSPGAGGEIAWSHETAYVGAGAGLDLIHFRGWITSERGGVSAFDRKTYTFEVVPANHGMDALAMKRVGTMDVIGGLGSYGVTVTPVTGQTVWNAKSLSIGVPFKDFPISITPNPTKGEFYVPVVHTNVVDIVEVAINAGTPTLSLKKSIPAGCDNPSRVAFRGDGRFAFVACNQSIVTIDAQASTWFARSAAALLGPMSMGWVPQ